jgi:hypothetical protein
MPPKFELGKVFLKQAAGLALARAGQDAAFFLAKHEAGDWGAENQAQNEQGLREGHILLSRYRTLRGQELLVLTTGDRKQTYLFCPPSPVTRCNPLLDFAHFWEQQAKHPEARDSNAGAS